MKIPQKRRLAVCAGWIGGFVLLWGFYCLYHQRVVLSSDSTTMLPVASDLLSGNVLLRGWVLGTNNFIFTETVFYSLGILLGLSNETLMHVVPSLFYALFIVTMVYAFVFKRDEGKGIGLAGKVFVCGSYAVLVGVVAQSAAYTLLNANSHNNLYFEIILCWLLIARYYDTKKAAPLAGYAVLAALLSYSESVTHMVLFAPVGLFCLYELWRGSKESRKQHLFVIGATALGFLLAKVMAFLIMQGGGIVTRGLPVGLAPLGEVFRRVMDYMPQFYILFGFEGLRSSGFLGIGTIYNALILAVMIGCLFSIVYNTFRFKSLPRMDKMLYLITVVNLLACLFTDTAVFHRYIVPAHAFGVMLFLKTICRLCAQKWRGTQKRLIACIASACAILAVVSGYRMHRIFQGAIAGQTEAGLVRLIEEKDYGGGYGDYWCSSVVSYYSDFTVPIYPILINGGGIQRYVELVKDDWYKEKDKHFIVTYADGRSEFIHNDTMIAVLGTPDDSFVYGSYEVFYWAKDISGFVDTPQ